MFNSFQQLTDHVLSGQPLYLVNKTASPMKIIVVDYPSPEGQQGWSIPRSSIPFNITEYIPAQSLVQSRAFRKMYVAGAVAAVDVETAERQLAASPALRASWRQAYEEANNTERARMTERNAQKASMQSEKQDQGAGHAPAYQAMAALMGGNTAEALRNKADPKLEAVGSSARFGTLRSKVSAGILVGDAIMRELSLMLGDLSKADLASVSSNPGLWGREAAEWAADISRGS